MNPDPDGTRKRPIGPDDEELGVFVRSIADDWRLPPQRFDQPTWRDRVGGRPARRSRGWAARIAGPAAAAVVGTVIVAFMAVWLTGPRTDRAILGTSPSTSAALPSTSAAPSAEAPSAEASMLPGLIHEGDLPDPAKVMVQTDTGYQIADLTTGKLGSLSIRSKFGPTTILARPGGGWLCICGAWVGSSEGRPTGIDLTLESADANGAAGPSSTIRAVRGEPDRGVPIASQPELVDVRATGSADGRVAFVAWSARAGSTGWTAGIDVIDVASATVVSSTPLAVPEPAGAEARPTTRIAPRIAVAPAGDAILVSGFWYVETPGPTVPSGTDHWVASFDGRVIGSLEPAGATSGARCQEVVSGLVDAATYYAVCWLPDGPIAVERISVDGRPVDRTEVPRFDGGLETGSLVTRQVDGLFLWDPVDARLTRFDLKSAAVKSSSREASLQPTTALDALAALGRQLGRWMAPTVVAKVRLEPALVAAADGTKIYALGIDPPSGEDTVGSSGIYVFDAASLEPAGHWASTADFASLAISPDGRYLYAAGQPGVDAAGNASTNDASITVYDTADGSINLIAGRLGSSALFFPGPLAR